MIGYGLIRRIDNGYDFSLDAIRDYLIRKSGDHVILTTQAEKWEHLCSQRNDLELRLRKMVRAIVRFAHKNESEAKTHAISKLFKDSPKYKTKTYRDLFDSRQSEIYFRGLFELIKSDWDYFADYFGKQDIFIAHMNVLNA